MRSVLIVLVLAACGGTPTTPALKSGIVASECRHSADCPAGQACFQVGEALLCASNDTACRLVDCPARFPACMIFASDPSSLGCMTVPDAGL